MRIATWNTRGLGGDRAQTDQIVKLHHMLDVFEKRAWDIVILTDVRWKEHGAWEVETEKGWWTIVNKACVARHQNKACLSALFRLLVLLKTSQRNKAGETRLVCDGLFWHGLFWHGLFSRASIWQPIRCHARITVKPFPIDSAWQDIITYPQSTRQWKHTHFVLHSFFVGVASHRRSISRMAYCKMVARN